MKEKERDREEMGRGKGEGMKEGKRKERAGTRKRGKTGGEREGHENNLTELSKFKLCISLIQKFHF